TSSCPQARRRAPTRTSPAPTTTSRSKERAFARTEVRPQLTGPQARGADGARSAEEVLLLQVEGRRGRLQERQRAPAVRVGEGKDPQPSDQRRLPAPPAPGGRRREARPRARPPPVRRRQVASAMEVILREDVDKVGLR